MKKIGILTFHNVYNYGGVLQAYALCKALDQYEVECIDYNQPDRAEDYKHKIYSKNKSLKTNLKHFLKYYILRQGVGKETLIKKFIKEYMPLSKEQFESLEQLKSIKDYYDVLISGSDQIWNPQFTGKKLDPVYFLEFGGDNTRKISYASSAGAHNFNEIEKEALVKKLHHFTNIAVREEFLQNQINGLLDNKVKVVLDPTLLLDREAWRGVQKKVKDVKDNYILMYTFDNDKTCIEIAKEMGIKLNCKVISISQRVVNDKAVDISLSNIGPSEFLWLFDNAHFVVTNSFHGTTFSIINRKSFYSIYKNSNPYRVLNLLSQIGLESRLVKTLEQTRSIDSNIDYTIVEEKLNQVRDNSIKYLTDSVS